MNPARQAVLRELLHHAGHLRRPASAGPSIFFRSLSSSNGSGDSANCPYWNQEEDIADLKNYVETAETMVAMMESLSWKLSPEEPMRQELMEMVYKNPCITGGSGSPFSVEEDGEAVYVRVDLPGVHGKSVGVWLEKNTLFFKGEEGEKDSEYGDKEPVARKYSRHIELPGTCSYQKEKIKAHVKDGVLRVLVPKVKA